MRAARQMLREGELRPSVRPERGDLVLYPEFLSLELMDTHVIASRMFEFGGNSRIQPLVTLTEFLDA